jgi:hypothetical protein
VVNATFSNISAISWRPVLVIPLPEGTNGVFRRYQRGNQKITMDKQMVPKKRTIRRCQSSNKKVKEGRQNERNGGIPKQTKW